MEAVTEEANPTVEEQAQVVREALRVTLNIKRQTRRHNDLRVDFRVMPDRNAYFGAAMAQILKHLPEDTKIKTAVITDSESKRDTKLIIDVEGNQELIVQMFQTNGRTLNQHCIIDDFNP